MNSRHLHLFRPDGVTYSCSGRRGALLWLPFPADHEETVAQGDFSKWIVKYIDDCFKTAEDLGCGVSRMEDIVLVTGRHIARSWISVAFSESLGGSQASFKVQASGDSNVRLEEREVRGGELKLGPSGEGSFHVILGSELLLRNHDLDAWGNRTYQRTNAFSFKGTVLFVS